MPEPLSSTPDDGPRVSQDGTPGASLVGRVLDGRYRVLSHIADGGMASVWRALDERLEREVAVKVLRPGLAEDVVFARRFRQEALSAARLNDPRVVAVYDHGSDGRELFLVMELVPGRTLRDVVHHDAPLDPRAALDILLPMAEALSVAHSAGLLHGDIKPENVLIRPDGQVKVADFGLARAVTGATATGIGAESILGTVSYLAPEQVERGRNDARSDVYAAGIVAFEMLTGRKPYQGDSPIHVAYQHVHGQVPMPSTVVGALPPVLDELVAAATARDPDDRPDDGHALAMLVRRTAHRLDADGVPTAPGPARRTAPTTEPTRTLPHPRSAADDHVEPTRRLERAPAPTSPTTALPRHGTAPSGGATRGHRPTGRGRGRGRGRLAALALLPLLLVAAVAGAGWWYVAGPGATTTVPDLARTAADDARSRLGAAHLDATTSEAFSETVPKGVVMAAAPTPGTELHRGDTVTLTVSKGPERHEVPRLAGQDVHAARSALTGARLTVGAVRREWSETVPEGAVISTEPREGAPLRPRAPVDLVVSKGREPISVPTLKGLTPEQAQAKARAVGLEVRTADEPVFSTTVPKGAVVRQRPSDGTLHRGDPITVTLSKGPELVTVPDVIGQQLESAQAALTAAGFKVKVERYFGGIFDTVRFQSVDAGEKAVKGSTITLTVV